MIYYTSDTHFGHKNIIKYSNRPFSSVEEMDNTLIFNWNSKVTDEDTIYHLGDFAFANENRIKEILNQLKGEKHLILGNHDNETSMKCQNIWKSISLNKEIKDENRRVFLFHYACRVWNLSHFGSYHLFGHTHGSLEGDSLSQDVGVDCWNYTPVTLTEVINRMNSSINKRLILDRSKRNE